MSHCHPEEAESHAKRATPDEEPALSEAEGTDASRFRLCYSCHEWAREGHGLSRAAKPRQTRTRRHPLRKLPLRCHPEEAESHAKRATPDEEPALSLPKGPMQLPVTRKLEWGRWKPAHMQRAVGGRDRVGIDDTKTRESRRKTLSSSEPPTQAKTGLEWATRLGRQRSLIELLLAFSAHQFVIVRT
jgi:hypothetical protein